MARTKKINIEDSIKSVIDQKIQEGLIEKLVAENLEKGINAALSNLFGSYGDLTDMIKKQIKEVMVKQLAAYDYSKYILNLDTVLTQILKSTTLDNKKILQNFKEFTIGVIPEKLKLSEIFEEYCKFVEKNINCSGLEVHTEEEPRYESVEVKMEVTQLEKPFRNSKSSDAAVFFYCEKDEEMNFEFKLHKWEDSPWRIDLPRECDLLSLRYINEFNVYLLKVMQSYTEIDLDQESDEAEVEPEEKPEPTY
jgi:hypothetical protein